MPRFAEVLPDPGRALSRIFTYHIPEQLEPALQVGSQVLVPFGSRTVVGVVAALRGQAGRADVKDIEALLEDAPALPDDALPLARWIADYYLCELGDALRPFLPEGMTYRIGRRLRLRQGQEDIIARLRDHPDAGPLVAALETAEGEVSLGALRRGLARDRLARALRLLRARSALIERAVVLPPRARRRQVRLLEVAVGEEEIARYCRDRGAKAPARVACLQAAREGGCATAAQLASRAGVSQSAVRALIAEGMLRERWTTVRRVPWEEADAPPSPPPMLTDEQASAVAALGEAIAAGGHQSFLLYGVTASGKTEVFLRAIEHVLARGRQTIVLMPEISLTAQAVGIYRARFGDRVAVLHSALSLGERWDEWHRIRTGEAAIVIGARSALFAPTRALGLIVVDEEHETSYKQEQAPRYHARDVALARGELNRCPVLLASATPSLESFHATEAGRHRLLRLRTRVERRPVPRVRIVDLRSSRPRPTALSTPLRQAIAARLQQGEQVILFLNRRGYATFLLCASCGQALRCPHCGISLTYHRGAGQLQCHHCGLAQAPPETCPHCAGLQIRFSGFGTERVEQELTSVFPHARPGRMDRDTTASRGAHLRIVGRFRRAETNVLIGTQMVAKGFDFPDVTLVGVISADVALNRPDFRAAERTFQLLTQVSGRSGRGDREGEVIIQTYRPDHYAIQAGADQDYEAFYRREIEARRELGYPPFSHLARLLVADEHEGRALSRANALAAALRSAAEGRPLDLLGPAPAPIARLRGRHRWHLLVRGPRPEVQVALRQALASAPAAALEGLAVDMDPVSLM